MLGAAIAVFAFCSAAHAQTSPAELKLNRIILPEVDFGDARLTDVVDFIIQAGRDFDPSPDENRRGVNIVVALTELEKARTISFRAKNVSLLNMLKIVSQMAGVRCRSTGAVMVIGGSSSYGSALTARSYTMPGMFLTEMRAKGPKPLLESLGVVFADGGSARYVSQLGRITVVNSADNMDRTHQILTKLGFARVK